MTATIASLVLALMATQSPEAGLAADETGGDLVIVSESDCPSSAAVRQALTKLRPVAEWPEGVVGIRTSGQTLIIDVGAENSVQRQIVASPDCVERAVSAALVIATWMDDLPAEVTSAPILSAAEKPVVAAPPRQPSGYEVGAALAAALP